MRTPDRGDPDWTPKHAPPWAVSVVTYAHSLVRCDYCHHGVRVGEPVVSAEPTTASGPPARVYHLHWARAEAGQHRKVVRAFMGTGPSGGEWQH